MGSCAAPSAKGDDKFITTDYLQQCLIKRQFGFVKARYKGLLKNDNQLAMLFTLANLFRVDQMIRQWERSQ
ncbi:DDE transposase [Serratia marcescens]|nr:DDE transposase [Serratia marcescens]BAS43845.1 transposase insH for insertion sequence element IS5Y [Klebsiella oxytoca]